MIISSYNEWDPLKEIVVGSATHANWPVNDPVFSQESRKTLWNGITILRILLPTLALLIDILYRLPAGSLKLNQLNNN